MSYIKIFILLIILYFSIVANSDKQRSPNNLENFVNITPLPKLKMPNINPIQDIPPGFTDMHYKFNIKKAPINRGSDYCNDNPKCYPCKNWTHIGPPNCIN